jgi:hypothetical protein
MSGDLVSRALRDVACLPSLALPEWDLLIRQARSAALLSRLAVLVEEAGLTAAIPEAPRQHLISARLLANAQAEEVVQEVEQLRQALAELPARPILLKGAAYLLADLPAAKGRVFSDVDVLVPKASLPQAEASLMAAGWATTHHDPYDQRYYRQWMHELPPFQHIRRGTVLDVHHGILPDTARLRPDAGALRSAAVPATGDARLDTLSPADMVLHSMTHLFHNEELHHGLRDISDMDLLLRHFGDDPAFWGHLAQRARQLGLTRPLYYGLRYTTLLLHTPVPDSLLAESRSWGPAGILRPVMDMLWLRALRPHHASVRDWLTSPALFMLYIRAHWLRMPPILLARHLAVKALRRNSQEH